VVANQLAVHPKGDLPVHLHPRDPDGHGPDFLEPSCQGSTTRRVSASKSSCRSRVVSRSAIDVIAKGLVRTAKYRLDWRRPEAQPVEISLLAVGEQGR